MHALLVGLAIGGLWGLFGFWRTVRRERRLAIAERRAEARMLARRGLRATPSWSITKPTDPVLADPEENARYEHAHRITL